MRDTTSAHGSRPDSSNNELIDRQESADELITRVDRSTTVDDILDPIIDTLKTIRLKSPKSVILGHINVNSIRYKFYNVCDILNSGLIDVLAITETKLDDSFPMHQFKIDGFKILRNDFNKNSGGIMIVIRDDIPHSRKPEYEFCIANVQSIVVECIISKEKWYFITFYKSPKVNTDN